MYSKTLKQEIILRRLSFGLLACLVALSGLYIYLINDSVFNVARRQDTEERITSLEAKVASLEADYMSKLSQLNLEYAKSLGFIDSAQNTTYAVLSRPAVSMVASRSEI